MEENERVRRDVREILASSDKTLLDDSGHIIYNYMGTDYLVLVSVVRVFGGRKLGEYDE